MSRSNHIARHIFRIAVISLALIIVLAIISVCGLMVWLTPERLTNLINREASEYLDADVRASNVRYSLWSSFPDIKIEVDSVRIVSRALKNLPQNERQQLPSDPDFLAYASGIQGDFNLPALLRSKISVGNISIDSVSINAVALSDTVANYLILPATPKKEMPAFSLGSLTIKKGLSARAVLQQYALDAHFNADKLGIFLPDEHTCRIGFAGTASLEYDGIRYLRNTPVSVNGVISANRELTRFSTRGLHLGVGPLQAAINTDFSGKSLDSFSLRLLPFNIQEVMKMVPGKLLESVPMLKSLNPRGRISLSGALSSPLQLDGNSLPAFEMDLALADAALEYSSYPISDINLRGNILYDTSRPEASFIDIRSLSLKAFNSSVSGSAHLASLLSEPNLSSDLKGIVNLPNLPLAKVAPGLKFSGDAEAAINLQAPILDLIKGDITRLAAGVKAELPSAAVKAGKTAVNAQQLHLEASIANSKVTARVHGGTSRYQNPSIGKAAAGNFSLQANTAIRSLSKMPDSVKVDFNGTGLRFTKDTTDIHLNGLKLHMAVHRRAAGKRLPKGAAAAPTDPELAKVQHTDEYLTAPTLPPRIATLLRQWDARCNLSLVNGKVRLSDFPEYVGLRNISFFTDLDSIALRSLDVRVLDTHLAMEAFMGTMRNFLLSPAPERLPMAIRLTVDTLNLNRISKIYERGMIRTMGDSAYRASLQIEHIPPESIAWLIPKNLCLDLKAKAARTDYINLQLNNILANVRVADGLAHCDTLHIATDFGRIGMNFIYDTSRHLDMRMKANVSVRDCHFTDLLHNFPKLVRAQPQLVNLHGLINADASGEVRIFPDMYFDVPSLQAGISLKARHLRIHQNRFISKLRKKLLIPSTDDLHIENINMFASVHDNLFQVYPIYFNLANYELEMLGMNNFNGEFAYHIGVRKFPLHFRFGVNIEGTYQHPRLHFGGVRWTDRRASQVADHIERVIRINLPRQLKYFLGAFVHTGADYRPADYSFPWKEVNKIEQE